MKLVAPTPSPQKQKSLPHISNQSSASALGSTIKIIGSGFVVFMGAQLAGPLVIALFAELFLRVQAARLSEIIDANAFVRFVTILLVEMFTIWFVLKLVHYQGRRLSQIGLGRKPEQRDVLRGVGMYVVYFVLYIAIVTLVTNATRVNTSQEQQLGFGSPHGAALVATFVSLVILPPLAEEFLFRGYLFFRLKEHISPLAAGLLTSLLFGIAHLEFGTGHPLNFAAAIDTFTLSCVLVYFANKYKSIYPGMLTHAIKNLFAFTLLFVLKR